MKDELGKVWLVGAGPSDAGLMTVKGLDVINNADVVVYDNLVGDGILSLIPLGVKGINVGKIAGNHPVPQEEINRILLSEAKLGKKVVRLKGGDPFVFGRGGEELELLIEEGIPFEIVPGVTSAVAVAAYNGIPVTHRDFTSSFHVITGHTKTKDEAEIDYEALVKLKGTLIFLMGIGAMERICDGLIKAGMSEDMPAAVLEKGTKACQRKIVATISTLKAESDKAQIQTPAIIIVGEVCSLADRFEWASKRSLGKLKIGICRPQNKISKMGKKLAERGAEVVLLPSISTVPLKIDGKIKETIENIRRYSWIAFTSPAAVEIFMDMLMELERDVRTLWNVKFAVVGAGTAKRLREFGILADAMPNVYTGDELGKLLRNIVKQDEAILIPRAQLGGSELLERLDEGEIEYDDLPIYKTEYQRGNGIAGYREDIDIMAFTSASTVKSFVQNNSGISFADVKAVCIGAETAREAEKYDMQVFVSPRATIDDMILLIEEKFGYKSDI